MRIWMGSQAHKYAQVYLRHTHSHTHTQTQALDLDSNCAAALLQRARCYVSIGDLAEAVSDFERVLATSACTCTLICLLY
jgi:hypothetical protein